MSYSLAPSSFTINGSGHLIATYANGTSSDLGNVVGTAGASGDLFLPVSKSASYTLLAGDLTGQQTPVFIVNATTGAQTFTIDAALLFNATGGTSLAVEIKRDPADTSTNTITVAAKSGQTIEGVASMTLPAFFAYTVIARSATALLIV